QIYSHFLQVARSSSYQKLLSQMPVHILHHSYVEKIKILVDYRTYSHPLITFAGTPTATAFFKIFLVTMAPAPIFANVPMFILGSVFTLSPKNAPSFIIVCPPKLHPGET